VSQVLARSRRRRSWNRPRSCWAKSCSLIDALRIEVGRWPGHEVRRTRGAGCVGLPLCPHAAASAARDFAARFPTIDAYGDATPAATTARFLLQDPHAGRRGHGFLDASYAFVGTVEAYALSLGLLFGLAGVTAPPTERQRETPPVSGNEVALTDALRERILAANRLDQALHAHVSATLERHRAAWLQWQDAA